jgi:Holliday junction resolvase RusA-like endonuclease
VLDALTGVVYLDDSQIRALHIFFAVDAERPRVEITIN